jgi:hypothetical protein
LEKPKIIRQRLSEEQLVQFEEFFADKSNVAMSSYRTDPKTNMPILYLQDQKNSLWTKFHETYPNGMKRTTFMTRLQDGPYKYRSDLGGLCSTCAEYGYAVFDDLVTMVKAYVASAGEQVLACISFEFIRYTI